jgi:hypothetical protein
MNVHHKRKVQQLITSKKKNNVGSKVLKHFPSQTVMKVRRRVLPRIMVKSGQEDFDTL